MARSQPVISSSHLIALNYGKSFGNKTMSWQRLLLQTVAGPRTSETAKFGFCSNLSTKLLGLLFKTGRTQNRLHMRGVECSELLRPDWTGVLRVTAKVPCRTCCQWAQHAETWVTNTGMGVAKQRIFPTPACTQFEHVLGPRTSTLLCRRGFQKPEHARPG